MNVGPRRAEPGADLLVAFERVLVAAVRVSAREIEIGGSVRNCWPASPSAECGPRRDCSNP
jgi:hypothetical protein